MNKSIKKILNFGMILLISLALEGCQLGFSFKPSLVSTSYGISKADNPDNIGSSVWRFEVRDGDCTSDSEWSDCQTDGERAEFSQKSRVRSEEWYGWKLFLPVDYPNIYPAITTLGQFHDRGTEPSFLFEHTDKGLKIRNLAFLNLLMAIKQGGMIFNPIAYDRLLIAEEELRGRWHIFEVQAKWHRRNGFFIIYVNGEKKYSWRGSTTVKNSTYMKFGIYRRNVSWYRKEFNVSEVPTQVAYFSPPVRATSREKLQQLLGFGLN